MLWRDSRRVKEEYAWRCLMKMWWMETEQKGERSGMEGGMDVGEEEKRREMGAGMGMRERNVLIN